MRPRILYCHCAFARVIAPPVKAAVLARLSDSDLPFDAVPDLCEMSARGDARLLAVAADPPVTIVACYERAVRGLFQRAGAPLPSEGVTVLNMRTATADAIGDRVEAMRQPSPAAETTP